MVHPDTDPEALSQDKLALTVLVVMGHFHELTMNIEFVRYTIFWCFLPLHRVAFCQVHFQSIYYCHSSKSTGKKTAKRTSVHCGSFLALFKTFCLFFRVNHLGGHMKIMIQGILQQFPHQGNLLWGIDKKHKIDYSCSLLQYT